MYLLGTTKGTYDFLEKDSRDYLKSIQIDTQKIAEIKRITGQITPALEEVIYGKSGEYTLTAEDVKKAKEKLGIANTFNIMKEIPGLDHIKILGRISGGTTATYENTDATKINPVHVFKTANNIYLTQEHDVAASLIGLSAPDTSMILKDLAKNYKGLLWTLKK